MARIVYHGSKAVGTSLSNSDEIIIDGDDCLYVEIPTGSSITSLTVWANVRPRSDTAVFFEFKSATAQTVEAEGVYQIEPKINGLVSVKLIGDAAGTVVASSKRMSQS